MASEFSEFPKMSRLSREIIVTEKIDGTNAQIYIGEDGEFRTGSRNRWIDPANDNFGFSRWAHENRSDLIEILGPGRHYGEWWGSGIQRRYGLAEKRFSFFNASRWDGIELPHGVYTVPILYTGIFDQDEINACIGNLEVYGSEAAPGFMDPEGIVIYHTAARIGFKKTIKNDGIPKSEVKNV